MLVVQAGLSGSPRRRPLDTRTPNPPSPAVISYTTASVNNNYLPLRQRHQRRRVRLQQSTACTTAPGITRSTKTWHTRNRDAYVDVSARRPQHQRHQSPPRREATAQTATHRSTAPASHPSGRWSTTSTSSSAPHDFVSFRSDFLSDKKGQRTGYADQVTTRGTLIAESLDRFHHPDPPRDPLRPRLGPPLLRPGQGHQSVHRRH